MTPVLETFTVDNTQCDLKDHAARTPNKVMVSDANGILVASDVNAAALDNLDDIPEITASTTDLTAGTSPLTTGAIYLVYEE